MAKRSAGLLMYRTANHTREVLLVHPGGPFWRNQDDGAWSIPKGEYSADEEPLLAARREFGEETGCAAQGPFMALRPVKTSGKTITAWAVEGDCDADTITSNTFTLEWPPHSGRQVEFPEVDRAAWFTLDLARIKIARGQLDLIDQLEEKLSSRPV